MAAYAYWNEIGSISQVAQAAGFGLIAIFIRFTVFRKPELIARQVQAEDADKNR